MREFLDRGGEHGRNVGERGNIMDGGVRSLM